MNKMTFGLVIDFCISCKFLNFRTKTLPIQFLCQMSIKNRFSLMNYSELWMNEEFRVILVSLYLKNDEMWSESRKLLHWKDILCTGNCIPKKKGVQKGQELQWKVNPHSLWKPKKKIISCLKTTWEYFFSWCHEPDRSCLGYTGALWVDLPFFPEATTILTASIVMWSRVNCWGVVIYIFTSKNSDISIQSLHQEKELYTRLLYINQ